MEHLQHFGFARDPFSNDPDPRVYFPSEAHRDAQRRVERGLRQRKGLTLLTGEGGMGKTLLARRILESLEDEVFEATLLVVLPGAADATGLLQRFARQLGTDQPASDRAALLGQIYEQLAIVREDGRHAVLMIDDAQAMSRQTLSELGGLSSLEYEERRLLSMLWVGDPALDALVQGDPTVRARVDVRVRLQPLDLAGTAAYLGHRLAAAQGDPAVLPAPTIEMLHKLAGGRPRLLNTLADNALFEAWLAGRPAIEPLDVERAATDLGVGGGSDVPVTETGWVGPEPGDSAEAQQPSRAGLWSGDDPSGPSETISPASAEVEPETVLHLDPPMAELELTAEVELSLQDGGTEPLELEDGLEATFAAHDRAGRPAASPSLAEQTRPDPFDDLLDFDLADGQEEDVPDPRTTSEADEEGAPTPRSIGLEEPEEVLEFALAEAELAPLEAGEIDALEDAFVELLEE